MYMNLRFYEYGLIVLSFYICELIAICCISRYLF